MLFAHTMQTTTLTVVRSLVLCLVASICAVALVHAQAETFAAVASMKTAGGVSATAPLTVVVNQFASDADQAALVATVKSGNTASVREWLKKRPDAGTLQLGSRRVPIKYVYGRTTSDGRLITVATAEPIAFV